jgi:hypothetical protein
MSDAGPSRIVGSIDIKILLAFVFAVVFALALLVFTTFVRDPSEAAVWTYKVILALAAAGFAAVLPGFLDVRYKGVVQAGGALAVFVVVLLLYPAGGRSQGGPGREGVVPKGDAALEAAKYLDLIDSGRLADAFGTLDSAAGYQWSEYQQAYGAQRIPLGKPLTRTLVGTQQALDPPGAAPGAYKALTYRTRFANDPSCRPETVTLRGVDAQTWKVYGHLVGMSRIDC